MSKKKILSVGEILKLIEQNKNKFGIQSDNPVETIVKSVGNRIADMSVVPYVRAQRVSFAAKGMKPLTNVHVFIGSSKMSIKDIFFSIYYLILVFIKKINNKLHFENLTFAPIDKDLIDEKSLRPNKMEYFIGQKDVVESLKLYIEAAKNRNESLDHVLLFGPPGLGKTTLSKKISKKFNWNLQLEEVKNNPYLDDFYKSMSDWSFHLQIFFLNSRFNQIQKISESDNVVIQDRSIYEDYEVFTKTLHDSGVLKDREFNNYKRLYNTILKYIDQPDLLIYLRNNNIDNIIKNIKKRKNIYII